MSLEDEQVSMVEREFGFTEELSAPNTLPWSTVRSQLTNEICSLSDGSQEDIFVEDQEHVPLLGLSCFEA